MKSPVDMAGLSRSWGPLRGSGDILGPNASPPPDGWGRTGQHYSATTQPGTRRLTQSSLQSPGAAPVGYCGWRRGSRELAQGLRGPGTRPTPSRWHTSGPLRPHGLGAGMRRSGAPFIEQPARLLHAVLGHGFSMRVPALHPEEVALIADLSTKSAKSAANRPGFV